MHNTTYQQIAAVAEPRVSAKVIAGIYGTSESAIRRYARIGVIPHIRIGKLIRFDVQEVEDALRRDRISDY